MNPDHNSCLFNWNPNYTGKPTLTLKAFTHQTFVICVNFLCHQNISQAHQPRNFTGWVSYFSDFTHQITATNHTPVLNIKWCRTSKIITQTDPWNSASSNVVMTLPTRTQTAPEILKHDTVIQFQLFDQTMKWSQNLLCFSFLFRNRNQLKHGCFSWLNRFVCSVFICVISSAGTN